MEITKESATREQPYLNSLETYTPERLFDASDHDVFSVNAYVYADRVHMSREKYDAIFRHAVTFYSENERPFFRQTQNGEKKPQDLMNDCANFLRKNYPAEMSNQNDFEVVMNRIYTALYRYYILQPIIDNPRTTDIKICAPDDIRIRLKGKAYESDAFFLDEKDLSRFVEGIAIRNHIDIKKSIVVTFTDNHDENYKLRFTISLPVVNAVEHPYLHIRKIPKEKPDFEQLIKDGMLDDKIKHYLIDRAQYARGIIFAGPPGCVDSETEFFNGKQWKSIAEWDNEPVLQFDTETNEATLVKPFRYIKEPCDKMYHFETKYGIDQTLSPEHRVIFYNKKKKNGKKYWGGDAQFISTEELMHLQNAGKFYGGFKTNFFYDGPGLDLTDTEIKLMLAVICDGTLKKNRKNTACIIKLKKERKIQALKKLLDSWGQFYTCHKRNNGYTSFYFYPPRCEKIFSSDWYRCSNYQLKLICDNILQWDGTIDKNGKRKFDTTDKESADFIQFAFSACGYRATVWTSHRKGDKYKTDGKDYVKKTESYTICITDKTIVGMAWHNDGRDNNVMLTPVTPQDGYKYCFTVPTHALVLRRNDKIFITGNSGKTTALNAYIEYIPSTRETLVIQENDELHTKQKGFMFKHVTHGFHGEPIVTLEDLGRMALVEGCNQFIIGEAKGGEMRSALTLLNSGGYGALTLHANSVYDIMDKGADLVKYGSSYTFDEAKRMMKAFDTLVYMEGYKVRDILEVVDYDSRAGQFIYRHIYHYSV